MRCDFMIGRTSGLAALAGVLFALTGCATEDDGSNWPAVGAIEPPFDYRDVPEPYADGDVAACKAYLPFGEGATTMPAVALTRRECLCDNPDCIDLIRQCDALQGCTEMRLCGIETGCNDSNSCYLYPPPLGGKCRAVYDRWGNSSVSTGLNATMQNTCGCN